MSDVRYLCWTNYDDATLASRGTIKAVFAKLLLGRDEIDAADEIELHDIVTEFTDPHCWSGPIFEHSYEDGSLFALDLRALTAAGYAVVPVEPTEAMVNAIRPLPENWIGHGSARPETIERWQIGSVNAAVKFYRAMIAAAKEEGK